MLALLASVALLATDLPTVSAQENSDPATAETLHAFSALESEYDQTILPLLREFCLDCHSTESPEGELDLERFQQLSQIRNDWRGWQRVAEMLDNGEMPPEESQQPEPHQRQTLRDWVQSYLDAEALATAGDPGPVVLRRLDHASFTYTIEDLTGVALDPVKDFPVDGAAGEGFTNTGDGLVMSPALLEKYITAAKGIAEHAVLLPDGIAFSEGTTRREWTNERLRAIRSMYVRHTTGHHDVSALDRWTVAAPGSITAEDGRVDLVPYFTALIESRDELRRDLDAAESIAAARQLNPKYFRTLAEMLTSGVPATRLLESLRRSWRDASPGDAAGIATQIRQWQDQLWKFNNVGHFGNLRPWQEATQPAAPLVDLEPVAASTPTDASADTSADASADTSADGRADPGEAPDTPPEDLTAAYDDFRHYFPAAMCYPRIVPVDEVVTLVLLHREDHQLSRLMLSDEERAELDRLWEELHFVSQAAVTSVAAFEQLMEFATQDGDPKLFEPMREVIQQNAEAFHEQRKRSEPVQLAATLDFADRAFRRPLTPSDTESLTRFYEASIAAGETHDDSIRLLLARILASPRFLYRWEEPGPDRLPVAVDDHELASRLSYFLWSSMPDASLREAADQGWLQDEAVLTEHTRRMLKDDRVRRLATEFACQWLGVRNFDEHDEKSEAAFPTFAQLRDEIYEESILFFTDLFREDRSVLSLLDADHVFVNGTLATHYGIPGVEGDDWQRVDDARVHGRGGILGLASVLAKQSGASRTSPILRGVWISEVLLGERLPSPPKDVPLLPNEVPQGLTERQLIERHSSDPGCAKCHATIDPYGFTLESFDGIGRFRSESESGQAIDASSTLPDGTELSGVDGLRDYLLTVRRDDFLDQFCRKLLGYALGRATQLSDQPLIDEMKTRLAENNFRFTVAVETIVRSDPFQQIRGIRYAQP